jgi:hypothetical protein
MRSSGGSARTVVTRPCSWCEFMPILLTDPKQPLSYQNTMPRAASCGSGHSCSMARCELIARVRGKAITEQPGIADMIEVSMREDDGPDILRRNPDISELITHGPDHDAPDVMGNNPASRFICDRIFDAGIEHDTFARTVDQIGIAAQCDLLTFPFPRCIDGSVRLHGNTSIQYEEPIYRSSLLCILMRWSTGSSPLAKRWPGPVPRDRAGGWRRSGCSAWRPAC